MGRLNRSVRKALVAAGTATLGLLLSLALSGWSPESRAAEEYADVEADDCLECHDQDAKYPVLSILATPHAVKADPRTPMASQHQCQTCHGPSEAHVESDSETPPPPAIAFGPDAPLGPQNEVCLGCHAGSTRMNWAGSQHDLQNVPCTGCHQVHSLEDQVLVKNIDPTTFTRKGQAAVCFQCHTEKRAQIQHRVSSHPLREGKIECSDCHNPHGSIGPVNVSRPTLNQTCYQCHAEKRGPFLWEHAPVREDCGICHVPHGSNNPALLRTRMPQLCQQCHLASFHPSTAYGGPDPGPPVVGERHTVAKSCLNCHIEVHGSNHPSGVRWTR